MATLECKQAVSQGHGGVIVAANETFVIKYLATVPVLILASQIKDDMRQEGEGHFRSGSSCWFLILNLCL